METLQNIADTKIIVGDGKIFYAYSQKLKKETQYFNFALSESWARKEDDFYIIMKPNATKDGMDNILQYLYSRKQYNSQEVKEFINTFSLADEMLLDAYLVVLRQYFDTNIEILLKKDLLLILDFIENHNHMQEIVVKTIFNKPKLFFSADKFQNIPIRHLKLVISKNNLNIEELQIIKDNILQYLNSRKQNNPQEVKEFITAFSLAEEKRVDAYLVMLR
ncbi:kelch-like protein 17 [Gigaspora margarita]|uniref:Kelch-like protein 17 n=1 Tax=Gigaspora margarita TaxID=4874 RepID=A0A8H4AL48_GIGMA|nr:kelch-like protein 17 [Gigaspora margarita]